MTVQDRAAQMSGRTGELRGDLRAFGDPSSLAVVGASDDPAKWGYWLARGALQGKSRRNVWFVNRNSSGVQGQPTFASVSSLPQVPELVVICVPAAVVTAVIDDALAAGARDFLVISAGIADPELVAQRVARAGGRLLGHNSLGVFDAATDLHLAWGNFVPGSLGIVSQSGQLGTEIAGLAERAGLGVSRFVSVGSQLDVNAAEILDDLLAHDQTHLVALYLESFTDGAHLIETLHQLRASGKHTMVLTTGASESSQRLAASHTGSLTSNLDIVDAACRAAGAVRLNTPTELVELARYLTAAPLPRGTRVAVVSDSGGQGGIAADALDAAGLTASTFSAQLQRTLADLLPAGSSVANPIDLAGAGEADMHSYAELCERLAASGEVDAILVSGYLGCYGQDTPTLMEQEIAVVDRLGDLVEGAHIPLLVHSMSADSSAVTRMWEHHIPTFNAVEQAARALANAHHLTAHPGSGRHVVAPADLHPAPGYWSARKVLQRLGIPVPKAVRITGHQDASAAEDLTAPFVLKAGWLQHKSEHDGVVLGLEDLGQLHAALQEMRSRLGPGEYVVEEQDQRAHTVEILVGARRDPDFGATITVGTGGTQAELWGDVRTELAPVDRTTARTMIQALRGYKLLQGWRGKPPVDIDELATIVAAASNAICADPLLDELEINPVRLAPQGALAVDALISTRHLDDATTIESWAAAEATA